MTTHFCSFFVFVSPKNKLPPNNRDNYSKLRKTGKAIPSPALAAANNMKTLPTPHMRPVIIFLTTTASKLTRNFMKKKQIAPRHIPTAMGKITAIASNFIMLLNKTAYEM